MTIVSTVGIDLAKNGFSDHAVIAEGTVILRRTVFRANLPELVALPDDQDRRRRSG